MRCSVVRGGVHLGGRSETADGGGVADLSDVALALIAGEPATLGEAEGLADARPLADASGGRGSISVTISTEGLAAGSPPAFGLTASPTMIPSATVAAPAASIQSHARRSSTAAGGAGAITGTGVPSG